MVEKKATRFSFVNNKDTALTAPDQLKLARPDETDSDAELPTYGKMQKFVAAKEQSLLMEEKKEQD